jgi:hypothetical protein
LRDLPLLEAAMADVGNAPKDQKTEKQKRNKKKMDCSTRIAKGISTFFQARKKIEMAQVQSPIRQAIIDLTTTGNGWKHDHDYPSSVRMIRFSFSEDMRSRILNGR